MSAATFRPGDRFQVRPLGDRYDNVTGTIREIFGDTFGREQHAHVRHDDGTLTMWQLSRLEHIDTDLPDLPQRVRGATLTEHYVEADEREPVSADDAPDGGATWWECPRPGCDTVIGEAGPVDPDDDYDPVREHVEGHEHDDERSATPETDPRDAVLGIVGEVSAVALMEAARGFPAIFDSLVALVDLPRSDVAALLRRVADVMDGGSR